MNSVSHSLNVSIFFAVLFLIVSHPLTYKLVHRLFKPLFNVADKAGCATVHGLLLHTVVFGLVVFLISYFFGSSSMEMMTDGPAPSDMHMADAMGTPSPSEVMMDQKMEENQMDMEDDDNAGFASTKSQMDMPLKAENTVPEGTLAMGADDYEASPVGDSPADGMTLPMDQQMEAVQPMMANEGFTGYASVF